jgi:hypothetical protein
MKVIKAWIAVLKEDAQQFAHSATVKEDIANLKAEAIADLPGLLTEAQSVFAKLLLPFIELL